MFDIKSNINQTFLMERNYHPVTQRIKELIDDFSDGNVTFFSRLLGYDSPQKINRLLHIDKRTGKYPKPSADIIKQISNEFNISLEWLNTGKGERGRDPSETDLLVLLTQKEHLLSETIKDKDRIISLLEDKIKDLSRELDKSKNKDQNFIDDKL